MRLAALLVPLLLAAGACASASGPEPSGPVLLRFKPPEQGGPTAFPEASPSGVIDLSGPCVSVQTRPGDTEILVSSHRASVGRDSNGAYLEYDGRRFRHGDWVKGGGGHFDQLPVGPLDGRVADACRGGPFLLLVGIGPFDPSEVPPPVSPPPPGG